MDKFLITSRSLASQPAS